eukprot:CAMPEP_0185856584 /NCGR_PEP_ID=MMETSP1354-20130828/29075_1 /TAXON_ID=708628 /ORGANISM="Erythrolobus madagascarensis, Strain CCMP3276" /LENGTH=417 /DNA_ID=CAMNT_0028558845 /DNA_START=428 /DNA_END=1681 /DNA_ORIENTATION=+
MSTKTTTTASSAERAARLAKLKASFFENASSSSSSEATRYTVKSIIGEGAYGVVCSAVDTRATTEQHAQVAVKRMLNVLQDLPEAVRILRELKFCRLLGGHDNIVTLLDVLPPRAVSEFRDVFAVFELFPSDLSRVLRARVALSGEHVRWLMYQLCRAMLYIHSANVFHRDLKPSNILLNEDCDLRVCDFGLARAAFDNAPDLVFWTDYVATRWYRAPELILSYFTSYSTAVDMWAVGCIFAEVLSAGRPLFPGKNAYHQLELFVNVIGSPSPSSVRHVRDERAKRYLEAAGKREPQKFEVLFPTADPLACDLLTKLLAWDPEARLTATQALRHPYFHGIHELEFEETTEAVDPEEFAFERGRLSREKIQTEFVREIVSTYHPELENAMFLMSDRGGAFEASAMMSGKSAMDVEQSR